MKKTLAFVLALCCALSLFALPAHGAEKGLITVSGPASARRGDTVSFTVDLNRNPGVTVVRLTLSYDKSALQLLSAEDGGLLPSPLFTDSVEADEFVLYWPNNTVTENMTQTGRLATLSFLVKGDAPFSAASVGVSYSEKQFDIINRNLEPVDFELVGAPFTVACLHPDCEEKIISEATLEKAGEKEIRCKSCGAVIKKELLPVINSESGAFATVQPGEFYTKPNETKPNETKPVPEPTMSLEKITSGDDFDSVQTAFPRQVTMAFRVVFTKVGAPYVPLGDCTVTLEPGTASVNSSVRLYCLVPGGGFEEVPYTAGAEGVTFSYSDRMFFFVDASLAPEEEIPPTTAAPAPTETEPVKKSMSRESIFMIAGGVCIVLCGAVAFFLLRKGRRREG